jgi:hypothetical protein
MKKYFLLTFFFLQITLLNAQTVDWVFSAGNHTDDDVYAVATDDFGNTYVSGQLSPWTTIGDTTFSSWGYYLAKLDNVGQVLWVRHDDNYRIYTQDILIDTNGDVIVTGFFDGAMNQFNYALLGGNNESAFVFKYDSSGNVLWGKGYSTHSDVMKIASLASTLDDNNNVYLTGFFDHNAVIDGISISPTTLSKNDVLLIKLTSSGTLDWVKTGGGWKNEEIQDIAYYNNHLYLVGNSESDSMSFGNYTIGLANRPYTIKPFIMKYSVNGNLIWVKENAKLDSLGYIINTDISISPSGVVYTFGQFGGGKVILLPNDTIVPTAVIVDNYLARYDLQGNCIWGRGLNNEFYNPNSYINGDLVTDNNDNVYFSTNFYQNVSTETYTLTSYGANDVYLGKFNDIGYPQWAFNGGSTSFDFGSSLSLHSNQDIVIGGYFSGSSGTFGNVTVPNNSGNNDLDLFVATIRNIIPDTCPSNLVPIIAPLTTFCEGDSVQLSVSSPYAHFFQWYKDGLPIPDATESSFFVKEAGIYTIGINENTACLLPTNARSITKSPNPILELPTDTSICAQTSISITAISNGTSIEWSNGTNDFSTVANAGEQLTATAYLNGCITMDSIQIGNLALPEITVSKENDNFLKASGGVYYEWYFQDTLYQSDTMNTFLPIGIGTYEVIGYNENGCKKSAFIEVDVLNCANINIFPNPTNGRFTIKSLQKEIQSLTIYNTIGQELYWADNINSFDKFFNLSELLANGAYLFYIKTVDCDYMEKVIVAK